MRHYWLNQFGSAGEPIEALIAKGAAENMSDEDFIIAELTHWADGQQRREQIDGARYYRGEHDILERQREIIGAGGMARRVDNLPNNQLVDNQYAKMVDQKANYLLGKPFYFKTENKAYLAALDEIFDKNMKHMSANVARGCLNGGISWVHPHYDLEGNFKFKYFPAHEILPFWKDAEHKELDIAIRTYSTVAYEKRTEKIVQHVEVYSLNGIQRYIVAGGKLLADTDTPSTAHAYMPNKAEQQPLNWQRVPLVAFKSNAKEISLLRRVKSLQDAFNLTRSDWQNRTQEDIHNTILIIRNYDNQDLGEFREKLALYGAIKINDGGTDASGGVDTLSIEVNPDNFERVLKSLKQAIIENARGFDAKDDRMSGNPNEMNLRSMYSDIDLDADDMETEFQASFDQLLWFVDNHLRTMGKGDFTGEEVTLTFDRNMIVNDSQTITDIKNSVGIISEETLIAKHPFVSDPQAELSRRTKEKEEQQSEMNQYKQAFGKQGNKANEA